MYNTVLGIVGVVGLSEGTPLLLDSTHYAPEVVEARINNCASTLGLVATEASQLPEPCRKMELDFPRRTVIIREYNPRQEYGNQYTSTEETTYKLPTAEEFRKANEGYEEFYQEDQKENRRMAKMAAVLFGVLWAGLNITWHRQGKKEKARKLQESKPEAS